jgi:predicted patatin/cPLA2 family phospholipase
METTNAALILEGGGLRGVYTSGVLRWMMDAELWLSPVIGVSMGACNGANYVSRQRERNRIVNIRFVNDRRYLSYLRLAAGGELFGMDFIFDDIPHRLVPFDFQVFMESEAEFWTTATDCLTGEPVYFEKTEVGAESMTVLRASCALPFIARPVHYQGRVLMDGGIADPVPIRKSLADGNRGNVLVLTQPKGYRKTASRLARLAPVRYPALRGMCEALAVRHLRYNETMDFIDDLEDRGEVFVIRPAAPIGAGRVERDKDKLHAAYDQGYSDALERGGNLRAYLPS